MIYIIILILILIGIYRYDYREIRIGNLAYWILVCTILILIAGLRYRLGTDTIVYMRHYENLHPITKLTAGDLQNSRFAPGYIILTSAFKALSPDFVYYQFFHALVFNTVVFYFIYKNSRNKFFGLLIYFIYLYFIMSFQQMREALAVAIFLLAWPAFRDGKWIWWYISALFAVTFHVSASIMFILPIICLPGIRQMFVFGKRTIFVCLGIMFLAITIHAMFFKYIELLALSESITERAEAYDKSELGSSTFNIVGATVFLFQYILYPILALIFTRTRNKKKSLNRFNKEKGFVLMSIYVSIFTIYIAIIGRFNNYFFFFTIVFLSSWVFQTLKVNGKRYRLKFIAWMILFVPMFTVAIYNTYYISVNKSGNLKIYMFYYPYNSVLDEGRDANREKAMSIMMRRF